MEQTLGRILGKPNDYKRCRQCGVINWYENKHCHSCQHKQFRKPGDGIENYCKTDIEYYTKDKEYTKREAEDILCDI